VIVRCIEAEEVGGEHRLLDRGGTDDLGWSLVVGRQPLGVGLEQVLGDREQLGRRRRALEVLASKRLAA
jgi:hypothetical protein